MEEKKKSIMQYESALFKSKKCGGTVGEDMGSGVGSIYH
jgi:hypothetical protein